MKSGLGCYISYIKPKITVNIMKVNYSVRIHKMDMCKCVRIRKRIAQTKIKRGQKVVYAVEKLWKNSDHTQFPDIILITDSVIDEKNSSAHIALHFLFSDSVSARNLVNTYFRKYKWSFRKSVQVRSIVKQMMTICFCRNDLLVDKTTCNAGFIIVGTEPQMKSISHCFNRYCSKTEFLKAYIIQLSNIHLISKQQMQYNITIFSKSKEIKMLDSSYYTLVGEENHSDPQNRFSMFSFPFGKREWFSGTNESSLECAKRELFEELNIQFSQNIWTHSQKTNWPKYIYQPGIILFFLYLSPNTSIKYHDESDTIYLDCEN